MHYGADCNLGGYHPTNRDNGDRIWTRAGDIGRDHVPGRTGIFGADESCTGNAKWFLCWVSAHAHKACATYRVLSSGGTDLRQLALCCGHCGLSRVEVFSVV